MGRLTQSGPELTPGREFTAVERRVRAGADRLGGRLQVLGTVDERPLLFLELPARRSPLASIYLSAGIHGEEPGSVGGLLRWLEGPAASWLDRFEFVLFPCLNPWGYERGKRENRAGLDLNRQFRRPEEPLVGLVRTALAQRRFAICLDLHEDCDYFNFYLYELRRDPPWVGERIVERVRSLGPIADGSEDPALGIQGGIVRRRITEESMGQRELWPIAFQLYLEHTAHVVTVETPGRQPLALREAMQVAAVEEALHFVNEKVS